jgi:hypothetical protein
VLRFACPSSATPDSAWVAAYEAAGLLEEDADDDTDDPPDGVQIEIETGGNTREIVLQEAGTVSDPAAVLRACLSLAGQDASSDWRSLDVVTQPAPPTVANPADIDDAVAAQWLVARCNCLKGLTVAEVKARPLKRSGEADKDLYPRITETPLPDLLKAGIRARLETFTSDVSVTLTSDDGTSATTSVSKMRVALTLITTSAETKLYKWQDAWSYASAETAPDGLAQALLGHLSDCGRGSSVAVRLSAAIGIPMPGDCLDGLPCQSVEIDLKRETAVASFGAPSHLSAADLAAVLSGFRNQRRASVWGSRRFSEEPGDEEARPSSIVMPVSEESFSLGSFTRIAASKDGKKADVNPSDLKASGAEAKFRTVNFKGDDGKTRNFQVLATEPENGKAEEDKPSACEDHPEGGDGVSTGGSTGEGDGGVAAGGADDAGNGGSGGADGCTTQCGI